MQVRTHLFSYWSWLAITVSQLEYPSGVFYNTSAHMEDWLFVNVCRQITALWEICTVADCLQHVQFACITTYEIGQYDTSQVPAWPIGTVQRPMHNTVTTLQ